MGNNHSTVELKLPPDFKADSVKFRVTEDDEGASKLEVTIPPELSDKLRVKSSKKRMTMDDLKNAADLEEKLPMKIVDVEGLNVSMEDIGGYVEAKLEVIEFAHFLKSPAHYIKLGARMPKGAILTGPPGTGKTLLAKATASEAGVTFIACESAKFLIDGGAHLLGKVFERARSHSPCILFFDEIDCVGRSRPERYETPSPLHQSLLEELLIQLDGFSTEKERPVIVMGATNSLGNMDEALLRPGRFDRVIKMEEPGLSTRVDIYKVHMRPLVMLDNKDEVAKRVAFLSNGFTGAKIATVCNEAAMIAARDLCESVTTDHFESAVDRVRSGVRKKIRLSPAEEETAAYHDAGHAVIAWYTEGIDPPAKMSIIPTADSKLTCSQYSVSFENQVCTKEQIKSLIVMTLGGRAAEEVFLDEPTSRCINDLKAAANGAMCMITQYGFSNSAGLMYCGCLMPWEFGCESFNSPASDKFKDDIVNEMRDTINLCYERAVNFIKDNRESVEKVAAELKKKRIINRDDLCRLLGDRPFPDHSIFTLDSDDDEDFLPAGLKDWRKTMDTMKGGADGEGGEKNTEEEKEPEEKKTDEKKETQQ